MKINYIFLSKNKFLNTIQEVNSIFPIKSDPLAYRTLSLSLEQTF